MVCVYFVDVTPDQMMGSETRMCVWKWPTARVFAVLILWVGGWGGGGVGVGGFSGCRTPCPSPVRP